MMPLKDGELIMHSNSELIISIPSDNSEASVSFRDEDGLLSQKTVAVEDLVTSMADRYQFSTGLIPNITRYFGGTKQIYKVLLEYPAKVRRFQRFVPARADELGPDYEPDVLQIPFPYVLFHFRVEQECLVETYVRARPSKIQSLHDEVFHFPFGNVYRNSRICWGHGNNLPEIKEPGHLVSVGNMFLDLPYNGDLVGDGGNTFNSPPGESFGTFWELISYLDGETTFDNNILVGTGGTVLEMLGETNG
jgi:hypothetical protein